MAGREGGRCGAVLSRSPPPPWTRLHMWKRSWLVTASPLQGLRFVTSPKVEGLAYPESSGLLVPGHPRSPPHDHCLSLPPLLASPLQFCSLQPSRTFFAINVPLPSPHRRLEELTLEKGGYELIKGGLRGPLFTFIVLYLGYIITTSFWGNLSMYALCLYPFLDLSSSPSPPVSLPLIPCPISSKSASLFPPSLLYVTLYL